MKLIQSLTLAGMLAATSFTAAQAGMITGGFTGNWFNADTDGQGFQLQVLPGGEAVAFWFTYDSNGNQVWLIGNDSIQGNRLELDMVRPTGARFGADFNSGDVQLQPFGTVTLTFDGCNSGTVQWQSNDAQFGSGSMPIERLTASAGVSCTASVVDNRSSVDPVLDFSIDLVNEGIYPDGDAEMDYESRPDRVEFDVEVEDIPAGQYALVVDGVERGVIEVNPDDDGTEGEIDFSSPQDDDDLLLDFDPLGALIEIMDGSTVLFSGVLDPSLAPPEDDDDDDDAPEFGSSEIEIDLTSTGLVPGADGEAKLEQYPSRVEFEVEVEDLPAGTYELWVGGEFRAEIEVILDDDGTEGEVEFSNPVEPGKLPLDFDPIGQPISIEQNGDIFLTANFPTEIGPGDDDDGNNDEDDEDDDDEDEDDDDDDDDEDEDEDDDDDDDDGDD